MTDTGRKSGGPASVAPTRALDRGLRVLEEVAAQPNRTLGEIAEAVALSPATVLRILETLRNRDFVARDEATRTYSVGLKALEVGARFQSETRLQETSHQILQKLAAETRQTATLCVLHGADIVYIDIREGTGALRSASWVGARAPAHATASGKILLAWKWEAGLVGTIGEGPFEARTPNTITTLADLKAQLGVVRQAGVAFDREELNLDITCIAAPVRNRAGEVIAAIGVQGLTRQIAGPAEALARAVRTAAEDVSQRLGWRPARLPGAGGEVSPLID